MSLTFACLNPFGIREAFEPILEKTSSESVPCRPLFRSLPETESRLFFEQQIGRICQPWVQPSRWRADPASLGAIARS